MTHKLSTKQCQICFESIDINHIIVLCCSDTFHKQCMIKTIETKIDHSNILIQCPLDSCLKQIPFSTISQLLSLEYRSKYQRLSLNKLVENNYSTMYFILNAGVGAQLLDVNMYSRLKRRNLNYNVQNVAEHIV